MGSLLPANAAQVEEKRFPLPGVDLIGSYVDAVVDHADEQLLARQQACRRVTNRVVPAGIAFEDERLIGSWLAMEGCEHGYRGERSESHAFQGMVVNDVEGTGPCQTAHGVEQIEGRGIAPAPPQKRRDD